MSKLKCIHITEEFIKLTGNFNLAMLLSQFIIWSEVFTNQNKSDLWFKKSMDQMKEDSLFLCENDTIYESIGELISKGWLSFKMDTFDNTYVYRVNKDIISDGLSSLGYSLDNWIGRLVS